MSKTRGLALGAALVPVAMTGIAAACDTPWVAWMGISAMAGAGFYVLVDTRHRLSERIFSSSRKVIRAVEAGPQSASPTVPAALVTPAASEQIKAAERRGAEAREAELRRTAQKAAQARTAEEKAAEAKASQTKAAQAKAAQIKAEAEMDEAVRLIVVSGIFDLEWYSQQVQRAFRTLDAAVRHYLTRGRRSGFCPQPLFLPAFIDPRSLKDSVPDPLVTYLRDPKARATTVTHPLFDPSLLAEAALQHPHGPLAWFLLNRDDSCPLPYDPETTGIREGVSLADVRDRMFRATAEWRERELSALPHRGSGEEPVVTETLERQIADFQAGGQRALVSVILPTWNRAHSLRAAFASVQAQSYSNWELIIIDDGSVDDSVLSVEAESQRDPRIRLISRPHEGVSAARNAGLAAVKGDYVAFLDSDKEWDSEFLMSMLAALTQNNWRAAVAACEIHVGGRVFYRSVQPTTESLRLGNSIDQTAIVLEADVARQTGGFDESLKRAVDYDWILAVNRLATIHQISYVGVRYSEDDTDPNRISEAYSVAWNLYVSDRAAWVDTPPTHTPEPGLLSVVVDQVRYFSQGQQAIAKLREHDGGQRFEVLVTASSNCFPDALQLSLLEFSEVPCRVVSARANPARVPTLNRAIREAAGQWCLVTERTQLLADGTLADLVGTFQKADAAAVHPVVVGRSLLVENAGHVFGDSSPEPIPFLNGLPADFAAKVAQYQVPAAGLPLLMGTKTLWDLQGLNSRLRHLWVDIDLSMRGAQETGRPVVTAGTVAFQQEEHPPFGPMRGQGADIRMFHASWPMPQAGSAEVEQLLGAYPVIEGFSALSTPDEPSRWPSATWRRVPTRISVTEANPSLLWSIRTAAPADHRMHNWGDYHFAQALAAALERRGQQATVDFQPNNERPSGAFEDVVLNLRGLRDFALPADAISVIWVISHPDQVTGKELSKYNLRYAASTAWARQTTEQWGVDVRPLLQCTDRNRFYLSDDDRIPELTERAIMVGNSRKMYRSSAWIPASMGYPVTIYGTDWAGSVPDEAIAGSRVDNAALRRYYRSARFALNDHWDDMREMGFVSNRIFDVLASGGRLVTDDVQGLSEVFPDSVATYSSPIELMEILNRDPDEVYPPEKLAALSEVVRNEHSFDTRAGVLIDDVVDLRAQLRGARR